MHQSNFENGCTISMSRTYSWPRERTRGGRYLLRQRSQPREAKENQESIREVVYTNWSASLNNMCWGGFRWQFSAGSTFGTFLQDLQSTGNKSYWETTCKVPLDLDSTSNSPNCQKSIMDPHVEHLLLSIAQRPAAKWLQHQQAAEAHCAQ